MVGQRGEPRGSLPASDRAETPASIGRSVAVRVAGCLTILVGGLNATFGLLAMISDAVSLDPGPTAWLILLGLTTAGVGVLVVRGSRHAVVTALTVFGLLLIIEAGRVAAVPQAPVGALLRLGVLVVLVSSLGLALRRHRRAASNR